MMSFSELVRFCAANGLVLLADEVYQAKPATDDDSDDSGLGQTAEEVD